MNKQICFIILLLTCRICNAQNLVPNGDFESYSQLPSGAAQYGFCTGWSNCGGFGSPDYLHLNGTGLAQLPNPFPATVFPHGGSAIMGLILYDISYPNFREYVSHPLLNPLTIGQTYQLTFYVTNGTPPIYYGGSGCDHFSVAFSTVPLSQTTPLIINFTPQYIYNGFLYNNNWQQVTFNFTADSAYQHITFGSFVDDNIQQLQPYDTALSYSEAYYFIDDVSLTAQSSVPLINLSCTDTTFCEKHCIDFFDLSTNNPTSWQWVFPGADSTTSTLQNPANICYSTYGSFDVTLIACNAAGCDTLVLPDFINEYPLPVPVITQSNDSLLSSPGVAYQWWSVDSGIITGANNSYYIPTQSGNYYVIVTDSIGCSGPSNVLTITGISTLFQQNIEVSPNPFTNTLIIKLNSIQTSQIILYDITLRMLLQQQFINEISINTSHFAKGIYLYEVRTKNGVIKKGKVVKE